MGIEPRQLVVVLGLAVEGREEPLERLGHQIPRRPGIDPKALGFDPPGDAAEFVVSLDECHVRAAVGEITGRRQAADPAADDCRLLVAQGLVFVPMRRSCRVRRFEHCEMDVRERSLRNVPDAAIGVEPTADDDVWQRDDTDKDAEERDAADQGIAGRQRVRCERRDQCG